MNQKKGPSTLSVHLGSEIDPTTGALVPPIFQNAAFCYEDLDQWHAAALNQTAGHIYSRNTNPTTDAFEKRVAALEGAERATSFTTGMAAINSTLLALLDAKKRAVTVRDAYGATFLHFTQILPRFDVDCVVCDTEDSKGIEAAIERGCDLVYLETPTNPTLKVLDLEELITMAHKKGAVAVVDNTFATPINQSPIALGADVVIHSATKYLCGHGDVLGGVACGGKDIIDKIFRYRELTGPSLDAHCAFLLLRSLKTLGLRVQRQNENALAIASFLEKQRQVEHVFYPGLESHPAHEIAKKQMRGFGGVLSFELKGGYEAIKRFLPELEYAYMAANLGQVETIVGPPSTTSHVELTAEERKEAGVPEGLIRYAVGIEDKEDLLADLEGALRAI
jgi:cystathionine gamma-synthase